MFSFTMYIFDDWLKTINVKLIASSLIATFLLILLITDSYNKLFFNPVFKY